MSLHYECKPIRHFANMVIKGKESAQQRYNQVVIDDDQASNDEKPVAVKSFEEIPGPNGIFGIGTFYQYFKSIGNIFLAFSCFFSSIFWSHFQFHSILLFNSLINIQLFNKIHWSVSISSILYVTQASTASTRYTSPASINTINLVILWRNAFYLEWILYGYSIQMI